MPTLLPPSAGKLMVLPTLIVTTPLVELEGLVELKLPVLLAPPLVPPMVTKSPDMPPEAQVLASCSVAVAMGAGWPACAKPIHEPNTLVAPTGAGGFGTKNS